MKSRNAVSVSLLLPPHFWKVSAPRFMQCLYFFLFFAPGRLPKTWMISGRPLRRMG